MINKESIKEKASNHIYKAMKKNTEMRHISNKKIKEYAEQLKQVVVEAVRERIKYFRERYVIVSDVKTGENGESFVELRFDPKGVHRDSLYPKSYPGGVDNIVLLLTKGWERTKNPVHGMWHGRHVYGKRSRRADTFLLDAIREFNDELPKGVRAVIANRYK